MNEKSAKRGSEDFRVLLTEAVIQICRNHLQVLEFVHFSGQLTFSIDKREKLEVIFSDIIVPAAHVVTSVQFEPSTEPCQPLISTEPLATKQKRGQPRKYGDAKKNKETDVTAVTTLSERYLRSDNGGCRESSNLPLKDARDIRVENLQVVGEEEEHALCSLPSNCIQQDPENCHYNSYCKHRDDLQPETCDVCHKGFDNTDELKDHINQAQARCPQCHECFLTSVSLKKHVDAVHGMKTSDFSCQSCGQRFSTAELLHEHTCFKHENICLICGEGFLNRRRLILHRHDRHPEAELTCDRCSHQCPTKGALRKHMLYHRERDNGQVKCEQCDKKYSSGNTLYHHKRALHGSPKPYHCKACNKNFNFSNSMKLHMLHHGGQKPHKCNACDKAYFMASHLKHHVLAIHEELKPFQCTFCKKTFPYKNSLRLHTMLHTGKRPFICSLCTKSFVSRSALRIHETSHSENIPYSCDVCQKTYKTAGLLQAHKRRHTADGERFICHVCGRRFMYRSNLETHYAVHSEMRMHECKSCDKKFKTYAALYSHLQVHLASSPFVCTKCGKSFKTKERLKAHERRHLGNKPFVCQLCSNAFPDKGGLSKHIKSVHAARPRYACPACDKTCSRADNLRVHMKVHGNSDLLKLSLQDLTIAESMECPVQMEGHVYETPTDNPLVEGHRTIPSDQCCLQVPAISHNETTGKSVNLILNSSPEISYSHNLLGFYSCAIANESPYN